MESHKVLSWVPSSLVYIQMISHPPYPIHQCNFADDTKIFCHITRNNGSPNIDSLQEDIKN